MAGLNEDEFIRAFLKSQVGILHFIQCLVPSISDAEEILQETALVLWQKRSEYDAGRGTFFSWGCGVARFKTLNFLQRVRPTYLLENDITLRLCEIATETVRQPPDDRRVLRLLEECLQELNPKNRELLELHYRQKVTVADIAAAHSRGLSTIYDRLQNVRNSLARCVNRKLQAEA